VARTEAPMGEAVGVEVEVVVEAGVVGVVVEDWKEATEVRRREGVEEVVAGVVFPAGVVVAAGFA
jgi:hypothetical protein